MNSHEWYETVLQLNKILQSNIIYVNQISLFNIIMDELKCNIYNSFQDIKQSRQSIWLLMRNPCWWYFLFLPLIFSKSKEWPWMKCFRTVIVKINCFLVEGDSIPNRVKIVFLRESMLNVNRNWTLLHTTSL